MGRPVNSNVPEAGYKSKQQFENTGSIAKSDFAVVADLDNTRKIALDPSAQATGTTVTLASGAAAGNITLTLPATSGTLAVGVAAVPTSEVYVIEPGAGAAGHGSTATKIRRYTTAQTNQGTDITYADSATAGATFTINTTGVYAITVTDICSINLPYIGISKNSNQLTSTVHGITQAHKVLHALIDQSITGIVTATINCTAGDVIRPHDDGQPDETSDLASFRIVRIV